MRLGLAGHKVDPLGRTLKLREFLRPGHAYPVACDLTTGLARDADPLGNLDVGCCAIAGPGHFVRWQDSFCGRPVRVTTADVIDEYQAFGYVPGDESTDNGCYALDVVKRWRKVGLFGTRIEAFAQVDFLDREELARATFLLGGYFLCLNLPRSVQGADVWDVGDDDGGNWGGHLVWCYGTNAVKSWGQDITITDRFREQYAFDALAVVSADAIKPDGRAFSGLDLGGMRVALAEVTG